jgi:hypothetical protein
MGEGAFVGSAVSDKLYLRPDPDHPAKHGFVEPAERMPLACFQAALVATRDLWVVDES